MIDIEIKVLKNIRITYGPFLRFDFILNLDNYVNGGTAMKEMRCPYCNKMLGKIKGQAEIKCPRCKKIVYIDDTNN